MWKTESISYPYDRYHLHVRKLNPSCEHLLWTDDSINRFMAGYSFFNHLPYDVHRWDVFRYFVLYEMGGMYLDMDMKPLKPFDDLFSEETYCLENPVDAKNAGYERLISNAMMVCEKHSRIMKNVIDYLGKNLPTKGNKIDVINQTGPGLITKVFNETNEQARVLGHECFYPNSFIDRKVKVNGTYATHMFASSWHNQC